MKLTLESANEIMSRHDGDLDLSCTDVTSLPEGLAVSGNLDLRGTPIASLPDGLTINGILDLRDTPIASLPENLTVGGRLYLCGTPVASLPESLTAGGSLDLPDTPIASSLPDGLAVGGSLILRNTCIASLPEGLTVGGSLILRNTCITSLPDGLTIGGYLDLSGTPVASLPDGLAVGGDLALSNTPIASLPEDLAVGGDLYLRGTRVKALPRSLAVGRSVYGGPACKSGARKLRDGDYVPGRYLYADGTLIHVKKEKTAGGYTYYLGKIPGRNAISDGKYYAHCDNFHDGIADLVFKAAKDRGAEQYRDLSLDSELPADDMIAMYRVITGACRQGTRDFVNGLGDGLKDKYTVREAISLTEGRYGAETFRRFFAA